MTQWLNIENTHESLKPTLKDPRVWPVQAVEDKPSQLLSNLASLLANICDSSQLEFALFCVGNVPSGVYVGQFALQTRLTEIDNILSS